LQQTCRSLLFSVVRKETNGGVGFRHRPETFLNEDELIEAIAVAEVIFSVSHVEYKGPRPVRQAEFSAKTAFKPPNANALDKA